MPEDRAITVATAAGETLTFTRLAGFDAFSRCLEVTVGLTGPDIGVEATGLVNRNSAGSMVSLSVHGMRPLRPRSDET